MPVSGPQRLPPTGVEVDPALTCFGLRRTVCFALVERLARLPTCRHGWSHEFSNKSRPLVAGVIVLVSTGLATGVASAAPVAEASTEAILCYTNKDTTAWAGPVGGHAVSRVLRGYGFWYRLDTRYRKPGDLVSGPPNVFINHQDLVC